MKLKSILSLSLLCAIGCTAAEAASSYRNPIINQSVPDPTVFRDDDGTYYLYGTENTRNVPIFSSKDLVDWKFEGTAFTDATRPQMVPDGSIWAPDIQHFDGKYVLYYSKSRWGGEWECGVGVATADKPTGPFTDHGKMFISSEIGVQNSIDPFFFEEDGKRYLFWGSFRGIYGVELSDDGLSVREGAEPVRIAGTLTEGTNIVKRGNYYYLIGSAGTCCEGERSTYRVMMARATSLFGPYTNRNGGKALDNQFTLLLERSDEVVGPGHNSNFVTDDAGNTWMIYHGFDAKDIDAGRKVYMDMIMWDGGWPKTVTGQPSVSFPRPVIGK